MRRWTIVGNPFYGNLSVNLLNSIIYRSTYLGSRRSRRKRRSPAATDMTKVGDVQELATETGEPASDTADQTADGKRDVGVDHDRANNNVVDAENIGEEAVADSEDRPTKTTLQTQQVTILFF